MGGCFKSKDGQTLFSLVFVIGGIIAVVAITLAFLAYSFAVSAYGFQVSQNAQAAALAGVEDAQIQLVRNAGFSSTSTYAVTAGSITANVSVTQNSPSSSYVTVVSTATASASTKKISAVFSEDATTGRVSLVSLQFIQ